MELQNLYKVFLNSTGACTDTRKIQEGNVFFALKGENFNGNKYALQALSKGAIAVVVDEWDNPAAANVFYVDEVLETLSALAKLHRKKLDLPIIAITGSNGKTTTKELCASVLEQQYEISYTMGNLNNHIGVPLTLLSFTKQTEIGIVEMGANHKGEIAHLCDITQPDYGIITNIGKAHLEGFGGIEGVRIGKGEMYDFLKSNDKIIFYNSLDATLVDMLSDYGKAIPYDVYNNAFKQVDDNKLTVVWENQRIRTNLTGQYNRSNIAAAIRVGTYFKVDKKVIKEGLEKYIPDNNRSQILTKNNRSFILDAYNANPSSMNESLANFKQINNSAKFLILGDMLELGDFAFEEHQKIVDLLSSIEFISAYLIGDTFKSMIISDTRIKRYSTIADLKEEISLESFAENSITLLKGSRRLKLEEFLKD